MAAEAELLKTNVDRVTAAGAQAFRESIEKSLSALNELNTASKSNLEAVVESATAATKGAEAVGAQVMSYAKKSWEDGVSAAQGLSSARSLQDVVELQSQFVKASLEAYLTEAQKLTETVSSSVKDSVKPLNSRFSAVVERFQAVR